MIGAPVAFDDAPPPVICTDATLKFLPGESEPEEAPLPLIIISVNSPELINEDKILVPPFVPPLITNPEPSPCKAIAIAFALLAEYPAPPSVILILSIPF